MTTTIMGVARPNYSQGWHLARIGGRQGLRRGNKIILQSSLRTRTLQERLFIQIKNQKGEKIFHQIIKFQKQFIVELKDQEQKSQLIVILFILYIMFPQNLQGDAAHHTHQSHATLNPSSTSGMAFSLVANHRNENHTLRNFYQDFKKQMRNSELDRAFKQQLQRDAEELWKSKHEIKALLHPTIGEMPDQQEIAREAKTGVLLSQIKTRQVHHSREKNMRQTTQAETQRSTNHLNTPYQNLATQSAYQNTIETIGGGMDDNRFEDETSTSANKKTINQTPSRTVYCRYRDFMKLPQFSLDKPSIRNASPYVGDEWEIYRRQDIEKKKNFIDPLKQDFKVSFGKATTNNEINFIKNYVTATPSNPPMLHKFRDDRQQDAWLSGPFKF